MGGVVGAGGDLLLLSRLKGWTFGTLGRRGTPKDTKKVLVGAYHGTGDKNEPCAQLYWTAMLVRESAWAVGDAVSPLLLFVVALVIYGVAAKIIGAECRDRRHCVCVRRVGCGGQELELVENSSLWIQSRFNEEEWN